MGHRNFNSNGIKLLDQILRNRVFGEIYFYYLLKTEFKLNFNLTTKIMDIKSMDMNITLNDQQKQRGVISFGGQTSGKQMISSIFIII